MELTRINELMADRGYNRPIGEIFSDWEFVKDEILLPNRKSGSGNGTIHIYLLEDNMPMFRKCFSEYVKAFSKNESGVDEKCPKIKHFVQTSNVLTVAGFAYHFYNCDAGIFNYAQYSRDVMKSDDGGMIAFESVFKFSTENRPYFKQFDKNVFGRIIRYLFIPKNTAYKLYLYADQELKNYAVFWIIGQVADKTFIVDEAYVGKYCRNEESNSKGSMNVIKEQRQQIFSTPEDIEIRFRNYMQYKQKSERTVEAYVSNMRLLIPRAQKMLDGQDHPSPFTISDLECLKRLNEDLFGNPDIAKWNHDDHNRASAALHMYIKMYEEGFVGGGSVKKQCKEDNSFDFTLSSDEEKQKNLFVEYLKNDKQLSNSTCTNYVNLLVKKMSGLLRDYYKSNFRNLFAICDYKILLTIEKDINNIHEISLSNEQQNGKLMNVFNLYMEFVAESLTNDEYAKMVCGNSEQTDSFSEQKIFDTVGKLKQYTSYLPVYSLSAACGRFADDEYVEMEGWINVENSGIKPTGEMFVVHAKGHSMEPKIMDGDLCVFKLYDGGDRNGNIVLTQLMTNDIDYGGMYTIKKYYSESECGEDGVVQNKTIELRSLNPEYEKIVVTEDDAVTMKTIGLFVSVLR